MHDMETYEILEWCYGVGKIYVDMSVDVFGLEMQGNWLKNVKMLTSIKLWREKCDMCMYIVWPKL